MTLAILGATSGIARSTARAFFESGHELLLVARNVSKIDHSWFGDSSARERIKTIQGDVTDRHSLALISDQIISSFGPQPYVLVAVGSIEKESRSRLSGDAAGEIIDVNFRNLVVLMTPIAEALRMRGSGGLIFISSVSGDRGRQSNFTYGSAKAGLRVYPKPHGSTLCRPDGHTAPRSDNSCALALVYHRTDT